MGSIAPSAMMAAMVMATKTSCIECWYAPMAASRTSWGRSLM
jgi:hypothetical protein